MTVYEKGKIRGLMMATALFALVAGMSPMAQGQDEQSRLSAPMEGARLADTQRGLASRIEGSWVLAIEVTGQGTFNSLISFTAGGVVVTTASVPPASPFYGSWRQEESNRFNAAFYAFISDSAGRGVALSKLILQIHLTNRNELAGTAVGSTCDLQAENCVINPGVFQFTGKRLASE
jgi:hypothetical protein